MNQLKSTSKLRGPIEAPDFKQVRKYLRTDTQRETLGQFIKAGWTPAELSEFARQIFLAPARTYATAASYQYAIEKGPDHPYALETLASLRAPGFHMPPFNRPVPKAFAWDDPNNPEHTAGLRADIEEMARLWREREANWQDQPRPVEVKQVPDTLWRKLFKSRNCYHSLADTLLFEGLSEEIQTDVPTIARCLRNRWASVQGFEHPDANMPISKALWQNCFKRRVRYSSLEETLDHEGLAKYRFVAS